MAGLLQIWHGLDTGDDYRWFYIAKHRQGKESKMKLRWVGYTTSFENEI